MILFPSMTSINHLSSLYWLLFASSPSDMPKSKGVRLLRTLIVWTAASRTWVVDNMIGEYAEVLVFPKVPGSSQEEQLGRGFFVGDVSVTHGEESQKRFGRSCMLPPGSRPVKAARRRRRVSQHPRTVSIGCVLFDLGLW